MSLKNHLPLADAVAHGVLVSVAPTQVDYQSKTATTGAVYEALERLKLPVDFINPGECVVLKPNWVKEYDERYPGPDQWEHIVTHPDVIEATAAWAAERLRGSGKVVVCDAPQTDSSFATLRAYCRLDVMMERLRAAYRGVTFELLDLRPEEWYAVDGVTVAKTALAGDPLGSTQVALNEDSSFVGFGGLGKLYGASFNLDETNERHSGTRHEYMLCATPMAADVFINLPKMKTHKKVGVTCALKNLVGINANKNWLPHHTEGTPESGGDQFAKATAKAKLEHSLMGWLKRFLYGKNFLSRLFVPVKKVGRFIFGDTRKVVRSGNWYGNDTCWRMVMDLNKCFLRFDEKGVPRSKPVRYLAVVDGIIGGDGQGPMAADPKPCGVIVAGTNPLAVDAAVVKLMGFDWRKLKLITGGFEEKELPIGDFSYEELRLTSVREEWNGALSSVPRSACFTFRPHFGWVGEVEIKEDTSGA